MPTFITFLIVTIMLGVGYVVQPSSASLAPPPPKNFITASDKPVAFSARIVKAWPAKDRLVLMLITQDNQAVQGTIDDKTERHGELKLKSFVRVTGPILGDYRMSIETITIQSAPAEDRVLTTVKLDGPPEKVRTVGKTTYFRGTINNRTVILVGDNLHVPTSSPEGFWTSGGDFQVTGT